MKPASNWSETVAPDEAVRFEAYALELATMQSKAARNNVVFRALHAKNHQGFRATFTVLPDLPEYARVGLFAGPATYTTYVRFSNGAGRFQADRRPDVRGIALKLVGVKGRKLIPGMEDAPTQDFLLITSAATPVRNVDEFLGLVRVVGSPLKGLARLIGDIGLLRFAQIAKTAAKSLSIPTVSLATRDFHSALPSQFGAYAVHFRLKARAASDPDGRPGDTRDYLGEEITARVKRGSISYDFQAQFFVDDARTPIEDASVEWKESDAPFVTLARLDIPQQDASAARGRKLSEFIEKLAFDPWHSQAEFKPLGNMMRARNVAYRHSTMARKAGPEPDGSETF
ncbi:MAG: catalase [Gammaproteobacteria bacterium]